jgi:hypothetical protein
MAIPAYDGVIWGNPVTPDQQRNLANLELLEAQMRLVEAYHKLREKDAEIAALKNERDRLLSFAANLAADAEADIVAWLRGMSGGAKMPGRLADAIAAGQHKDRT